ncbi:DUF4190 domain-containing protein [Pseudolysinimonas sp.]|uniref:DUF4190 domain-containing protein n=1 Tax=Pseudolysinimonas sp. TaxID=2680009 RepID=UPI00286A5502|nr:DUF4190 domain-containing protein [Pseudolysinimonas sp.]
MATCANCDRELQPAWKYCINCGTRTAVPLAGVVPSALSADPENEVRRVNVLAVLALILGCLLSPLAALFGHIAVSQIKITGERGLIPAWIAVVLGYIWLVVLAVLVITFVTTNA